MSRYGISRKLECGYDEAVSKAKDALLKEGFIIISEVDFSSVFRQSLNKSFRRYLILGTSNPALDHKALTVEPEVGILLPSNFIVYENDEGGSTVEGVDLSILMSMIENPALALVAKEVKDMMERVIKNLDGGAQAL